MAVALLETDSWIQHLVFTGPQRPTDFGPADGVWYGLLSVAGDASGGNVTLNGRLSEDRKEDWVYVPMASAIHRNSTTGATSNYFEQLNTGPLIPTSTAVNNPTFNYGGTGVGITGNAITVQNTTQTKDFYGMPIFGDKRIPGIFLMYAVGFETNTDTVLYTASIWGWLFRYNGFFRGVAPSVG